MFFTIAMLAFLALAIVLHELGHAFAMRECGVRVRRISLLGFAGLGTIRLPFTTKWLPDTEWVIHPLLPAGAYVQPEPADMTRLSRAEDLYISGMGPLVNFIFGVLLLALAIVIAPGLYPGKEGSIHTLKAVCLLILATGVLWRFRVFVCRLVLPVIGVAMLVVVIAGIASMPSAERIKLLAEFGFFASFAREFYAWSLEMGNYGPREAIGYTFAMAGVVSMFVGALNLLPIWPLDGGQMVDRFLPGIVQLPFRGVGLACVVPLFFIGIWNDAVLLSSLIWS